MWCDYGAANGTASFAANWWNKARGEYRQVTINSRCGIPQALIDFDTPQYTTFSSAQRRKWETNEGMDPFSCGYNRATAPEAYINASSLIYNLVDIISKNGNFLLDIRLKADRTIVDDAEVQHLRETGKWIYTYSRRSYLQHDVLGFCVQV
ncbi:CAZyme family GH29 [Paecilomyces variotii]|nr:CAZyme family GH29 [Paecilomyces variotii]